MKYITTPPQEGETYRFEHNGTQLYDAKITQYDGTCWAKIKLEKVLDSPNKHHYKEGQEFDVKVANYNLLETEQTSAGN